MIQASLVETKISSLSAYADAIAAGLQKPDAWALDVVADVTKCGLLIYRRPVCSQPASGAPLQPAHGQQYAFVSAHRVGVHKANVHVLWKGDDAKCRVADGDAPAGGHVDAHAHYDILLPANDAAAEQMRQYESVAAAAIAGAHSWLAIPEHRTSDDTGVCRCHVLFLLTHARFFAGSFYCTRALHSLHRRPSSSASQHLCRSGSGYTTRGQEADGRTPEACAVGSCCSQRLCRLVGVIAYLHEPVSVRSFPRGAEWFRSVVPRRRPTQSAWSRADQDRLACVDRRPPCGCATHVRPC